MARAHVDDDVAKADLLLTQYPTLATADKHQGSWLHRAAAYGSKNLVDFWLAHGMSIDQNSQNYTKADGSRTPLHAAVNATMTRLLLSRGASINVWTRYGGTPLHNAVVRSDPRQIKALLEAGANTAIRDPEGRTPLDLAIVLARRNCIAPLRRATTLAEIPEGTGPIKVGRPARVDLAKDAATLQLWLVKTIRRFAKEYRKERVTGVGLVVTGIEGFAMIAFNTGAPKGPWDATFPEYAIKHFERWRFAYEAVDCGVKVSTSEGLMSLRTPISDKQFEQPFFRAGVQVARSVGDAGGFRPLNLGPKLRITVEDSLGHHAKSWSFRPRYS